MDSGERSRAAQGFVEEIDAKAQTARELVQAQINELDKLTEEFDLHQDIFTDVYGASVLNGDSETSRKLLENWRKLYEGISDDKNFTLIASVQKELRPGCYGFGQEAQYDYHAYGCIIKGKAEISFGRDEHTSRTQAVMLDRQWGEALITGSEIYFFTVNSREVKKVEGLKLAHEAGEIALGHSIFAEPQTILGNGSIVACGTLEDFRAFHMVDEVEKQLVDSQPLLMNHVSSFMMETFVRPLTIKND